MYRTTMKDDMDGATYPEGQHETEEQARQYAQLRTSQKKCEMKVISPMGELLDVYHAGEIVGAPARA